MQKQIPYILAILVPVLVSLSCSKDGGGANPVDCSTVTNKAFNADVSAIIQTTCAISTGCHTTGSSNGPGALTNHAQVFSARAAIRSAVSSGQMPQGGSLSVSQKNSIICWIDSGAPNN